VNDAPLVRGIERVGDLARNRLRLGPGQPAARDPRGEALAQFHDDRGGAVGLLSAADLGDVLVVERCERLSLAVEPSAALGIAGEELRQDLDRHVPIEL